MMRGTRSRTAVAAQVQAASDRLRPDQLLLAGREIVRAHAIVRSSSRADLQSSYDPLILAQHAFVLAAEGPFCSRSSTRPRCSPMLSQDHPFVPTAAK